MLFIILLLALAACPAMAADPPEILWGFADLHAHPAAHLGFGADAKGENGIVWGKPGMALETAEADLAADMPACHNETHSGFDIDPIRKGTRTQLIRSLDSTTGWMHSASGAPDFDDWPGALSMDHQQMHVLALRRAYEGGLRLMVATAVDNQLLSMLWTRVGFNLKRSEVPPPSPTFDYDSARKQIDFLRDFAAHNSSWMRIVSTAAEARQAIHENKLALVLGIEMDTLTVDQILDLVKNHGVRHVIPIHLVDNSMGGTALQLDVLNGSNQYLTGSFYQVACDALLQFRLARPSFLKPSQTMMAPGAIFITPLTDDAFHKLGYENCNGSGHRNTKGLVEGEYARLFKGLMQAGVLIDAAHMSELAMESALRLAENYHYPLMNSHTDIRKPCAEDASGEVGCGRNERDLKRSDAKRLAALGGLVGFGTSAPLADRKLLAASGSPALVRFTKKAVHEWSSPASYTGPRAGQAIARLRLTIATGSPSLNGKNSVDVVIKLTDARELSFPNVNQGHDWPANSTHAVDLPGPSAVRLGDITGVTLQAHLDGALLSDEWGVNGVTLLAYEKELDPVGQWLVDYQDTLSVMGGRRVALGTDMNGFAPQIAFAAVPSSYPVTVAARNDPPAGYQPPALPKFHFGARVYDFEKDGLAHYGMLPDFLQAVSERKQLEPERALQALYRTANDVVEMWEKAEQARGAGTPACCAETPLGASPHHSQK